MLLPELTPLRIFAISILSGAAIGLGLPDDVDKLQACWSSLVGGLCLVGLLLQVTKWQAREQQALADGARSGNTLCAVMKAVDVLVPKHEHLVWRGPVLREVAVS